MWYLGDVSLPILTPQGYDLDCGLAEGRDRPAWDHFPCGHMSLLEMMNWSLHTFTMTVKLLRQEIAEAIFRSNADPLSIPIEPEKN